MAALDGAASGAAQGAAVAGPYGALVGGALGALSGGGKSGGSGAAAPPSQTQTSRQDTSVDLSVETNVIGAPININVGGQQQADGSLSGRRYLDRGVDEPRLYAPFGTMQDVQTATRTEPAIWDGKTICPLPRSFYPSDSPCSQGDGFMAPGQPEQPTRRVNPVLIVGGVLIVAGAGLALMRRKRV